MRTLGWATLVAVVVGTVVAACGSTSRCDSATCLGCCDATGVCQAGSTALACGVGATVCAQCPLGSACVNGACGTPPSATGGGNATGGGGNATAVGNCLPPNTGK